MADALIGFGGNLGDARAIVDRAVQFFCDDSAIRLTARSSDYLTPPWGVTDQPAFVNLCIRIETSLSPGALLKRALEIEARLGRDRATGVRWGPRVVDIDVLAVDDLEIDEPDFSLPHPRMTERAFVLVPLAEIAPDRTIKGEPIRRLVERVDTAGITKLS
jgi:2-amino-4-hydroxy-6-hydroxymethyldihydropteridine diphosphokinase